VLIGLFVLVVAGCGGSGKSAYTAGPTATCLGQKGFTSVTMNPSKIGFIAAFAVHGGLRADAPGGGNTVVIAFAADAGGAAATEQAYTRHAPKNLRPHIRDVMSSQGNAVIVWTVTPSSTLQSDTLGCLKR